MFPRLCLAAAFLLIALLAGCASFVQAPRVTLKEAGIAGLDTSGINLIFHLGITNPNSFDLSLLAYTFDLQMLNRPLSSGGTSQTVLFPAGKETDLQLPVRLRFADLLDIVNNASDPDKLPYQLNTILHLKTPLGEVALPVEKISVLNIPEQYSVSAVINRLRKALRGIR